MVTLYDILRLTGILAGIGWTFQIGSVASFSTWVSALIAGSVGVATAWAMTNFTQVLARYKSEVLLGCAYAATLAIVCIAGAFCGTFSYRLLHAL